MEYVRGKYIINPISPKALKGNPPDLKWASRYMDIARVVATWSSCLRRSVGSVITVGRRIVATGYNGAPAGILSCVELGSCLRETSNSGENLDRCLATHSEMNSITQAAKLGVSIEGGDLFVTTYPCNSCAKSIINSGIKRLFYLEPYNSPLAQRLLNDSIEVYQMVAVET